MDPKYQEIDGDALLMRDVRAVLMWEEKRFLRRSRWTVEVEYVDGESYYWDYDTKQEAEAMRDAIKARLT